MKRYGETMVVLAVQKAGQHRKRASHYGQAEHFTPWEWLDLQNEHGFTCPLCYEDCAVLEPHHRKQLVDGGSNGIENILPVCHLCHQRVHQFQVCLDTGWYHRQQRLCEAFRVGDWIEFRDPAYLKRWKRPFASPQKAAAEIMCILPPEVFPGDTWEVAANGENGKSPRRGDGGILLNAGQAFYCVGARAVVEERRQGWVMQSWRFPVGLERVTRVMTGETAKSLE